MKLFDEVVSNALNPPYPKKALAENVLLRIKDLPSSWAKFDCILKSSTSKLSQYIARQILEVTDESEWMSFNVQKIAGLRQHVFNTVNVQLPVPSDVILQKFNSALNGTVKRDWPRKMANI